MNIIIFSLTILAFYAIISIGIKAFKRVNIKENKRARDVIKRFIDSDEKKNNR